jgi:carboxyl-terminal processing protease
VDDSPVTETKQKKFRFKRTLVNSLAAAAIFMFGWGIGNGRIAVGGDALYQKSVQKDLPSKLDYAAVDTLYSKLKKSYDGDLDQTKMLDGLRSGLANSTGDPYTEFFNPKAAQEFNSDLNGTFTGIGAELGKNESGDIIVVAPISGFPAEKAGLKSKDVISDIDDKPVNDMSITEAVSKIRGPKDTTVKLKVIRDNKEAIDFNIVRQEITIASVTTKTLDGNLGYIRIARFAEDTTELVRKAATSFKSTGVKGVVLDLRSDPGGLLDSAVDISSLWLTPGKTVLSERRGGAVVRTYKSEGSATLNGLPTVVLIDEGSASASEIVAGALRDNGAAKLIGVKSFGKGSVQQLEDLGDGSMLKVTVARWYTPNGKNIDKQGISPDKEVKLSADDIKNSRDPQLDAAIAELKK